jgi:outer membrane protein TolC
MGIFSIFRGAERRVLLLCTPLLPGFAAAPARAQTSQINGQPSVTITITLPDAIQRAEANEPDFANAHAEQRAASLERGIARSALLPGVVYHNQALYTEPNGLNNQAGQTGSQAAPVFIANNAVREYASQAVLTETAGLAQVANVRIADAAAALATAELEVARRGLVAATAGLFYSAAVSGRRLAVVQSAQAEAASFVTLTQQREAAREAAHADVLKATLTLQQRTRDVEDAQLAQDRAQLELAVLLFRDPLTPYTLAFADALPMLPQLSELAAAAAQHNPELAGALAALRQSDAEVFSAKAAYLPELTTNFTYGIDAPEFAKNGPAASRNLGYSFSATLDIPVWDWFATQHRVEQSEARRTATQVALTATQKRLVVSLRESYAEAQTARDQLVSLGQSAQTAAESLRLTRLRYTAGEATVLEVVDAETTLTSAQLAEQDGQVRYRQALSSLQLLTGVL